VSSWGGGGGGGGGLVLVVYGYGVCEWLGFEKGILIDM